MKALTIAAMISFCLIVALVFGVLPARSNPISDMDKAQAIQDLKQHIIEQYPEQYGVQRSLLRVGRKSFEWLLSVPDGDPHDKILKRVIGEYYPNFSTIKQLYKHEIRAYREINGE